MAQTLTSSSVMVVTLVVLALSSAAQGKTLSLLNFVPHVNERWYLSFVVKARFLVHCQRPNQQKKLNPRTATDGWQSTESEVHVKGNPFWSPLNSLFVVEKVDRC